MVIDDEPCIVDELAQKGKSDAANFKSNRLLDRRLRVFRPNGGFKAARSRPEGRVFVTTRSRSKASRLSAAGFEPIVLDWTDRRTLTRLPKCKRVLVAVAYDSTAGYSRETSQVQGLSNLLDSISSVSHVVYISTTGVYHQTDGSWVDEFSTARPTMPGGQSHLRAEFLLRRRWQPSHTILRLAGIYGPGRVPLARQIAAGKPIDAGADGYLNLIHVEDAATAVLNAWWRRSTQGSLPLSLYAVADDLPVLRRDFYQAVAKHLGVAAPRFTSPAGSLSARSASNKRIWNRRLHRDLIDRLRYPTYVADWNRWFGFSSQPAISDRTRLGRGLECGQTL